MHDDEKRLEAMNAVTTLSAAIVVADRKDTLTTPKFVKAMDRLEEMIESKEVLEQLKDPDAPEVGKDDQYVICGILMHWKQALPLIGADTDLMLDTVRRLRDTVSAKGLDAIPAPGEVIERRARTGKHAAKMHESMRRMLAALAANRNPPEPPTGNPT